MIQTEYKQNGNNQEDSHNDPKLLKIDKMVHEIHCQDKPKNYLGEDNASEHPQSYILCSVQPHRDVLSNSC